MIYKKTQLLLRETLELLEKNHIEAEVISPSTNPEVILSISDKEIEHARNILTSINNPDRITEIKSKDNHTFIRYVDRSTSLIDLWNLGEYKYPGMNITLVPETFAVDNEINYTKGRFIISEDIGFDSIIKNVEGYSDLIDRDSILEDKINKNLEKWQAESSLVNSIFEKVEGMFYEEKNDFEVSVVIPVYNTERYLKDTMDSLIDQSIGFHNLQVILIDDGSTDDSFELCKDYENRFPNNVIAISKENGGVSSARNEGLKHATGKFVNFTDSDDLWDSDAFEKMVDFFNNHFDEIDCVSTPVELFGSQSYNQALNFKYKTTRIVDITKEPNYIITMIGNVLFKRSALDDLRFDESLSLCEDILFNGMFMMNKTKYGVVADTCMYYRRRPAQDSLSGDNYHNKKWYLYVPEKVLFPLMESSRKQHGEITKYYQEVAAYWLHFSVRDKGINETLDESELIRFKDICMRMLGRLDDDVITRMIGTSIFTRNHLLSLKYNENIFENSAVDKNGRVRYKGQLIFSPRGKGVVDLQSIFINHNYIALSGKTKISRLEGHGELVVVVEGKEKEIIQVQLGEESEVTYNYDGSISNKVDDFNVIIRNNSINSITLGLKYKGDDRIYYPHVGKSNLTTNNPELKIKQDGKFTVILNGPGSNPHKTMSKSRLASNTLLFKFYCSHYAKTTVVNSNKALIISDIRETNSGNFEYIERYMNGRDLEFSHVFFPGKNYDPSNHELKSLAKKMCESKYIILEDYFHYTAYLNLKPEQEILQLWHGAGAFKKFGYSRLGMGDNIRIHKGYKMYSKAITSAPGINWCYAEAFGISEDKVKATGIPETDIFFDEGEMSKAVYNIRKKFNLDDSKKLIVFAPTYRAPSQKNASYDFDFLDLDSLYEELHDDYIFAFKWHPAMIDYGDEKYIKTIISHPDFFYDLTEHRNINELLVAADILITDYSSVIFDYSLLDKPIVFYAPDVNDYNDSRGFYYDFEEYTYGPVTTETGQLIDAIKKGEDNDESRKRFRERFMSACDGHSTEKTCKWFFNDVL